MLQIRTGLLKILLFFSFKLVVSWSCLRLGARSPRLAGVVLPAATNILRPTSVLCSTRKCDTIEHGTSERYIFEGR
jgi:hypothetical protein